MQLKQAHSTFNPSKGCQLEEKEAIEKESASDWESALAPEEMFLSLSFTKKKSLKRAEKHFPE